MVTQTALAFSVCTFHDSYQACFKRNPPNRAHLVEVCVLNIEIPAIESNVFDQLLLVLNIVFIEFSIMTKIDLPFQRIDSHNQPKMDDEMCENCFLLFFLCVFSAAISSSALSAKIGFFHSQCIKIIILFCIQCTLTATAATSTMTS